MAYAKVASGLSNFRKKFPFPPKGGARLTRTYIMPTAFGYAFATLAFVLLFMAIGYANNLIYFFVFFLTSIAISTMYFTNQNVDRVQIYSLQAPPIFAEEDGFLSISFKNSGRNDSFHLEFQAEKKKVPAVLGELKAHEDLLFSLPWRSSQRGWVKAPRLTFSSPFPFGLLRAWKYFRAEESFLIFPARKGNTNFPMSAGENNARDSLGLFRDHRPYQATDSPRRVDWRAWARHQNLLVKNYESPEARSLHFTWDQTAALSSFEDKISQLCLWVDLAEKAGHSYSLQIGAFNSGLGQGPSHWQICLQHLSLMTEGGLA